jgi:16S rRNA C967 or C1407 C5-methylase (RsmB/RsmF family)
MDYLIPSDGSIGKDDPGYIDDRVQQLAEFQKSAICHAFSFPKVKRVVYSTCSIYEAENESVIASVLDKARDAGFVLEPAMPEWHRRGNVTSLLGEEAKKVLRVGKYRAFCACKSIFMRICFGNRNHNVTG